MTFPRDPPRLRTLQAQLPRELTAALAELPEDNATAAELSSVAQQLRASPERSPSKGTRFSGAAPRPKRGPLAAVLLTFALGASAGVLASSGVFFALKESPLEPSASPSAPSARPPTARARPRPALATSAAPTPSASSAALAPPRSTRETAPAADASDVTGPPSTAASARQAGSRAELALLARAQATLASDPRAALSMADEHAVSFPQGALVQEREMVGIDALLRLGRRDEAVGRALRFHQQFPGSVHGRRIDVLLGKADHK